MYIDARLKTIARAALDSVLALGGCHANATMRYQARKVHIITLPVLPAHVRDCGRAAFRKDLLKVVTGA
jgi:hypothetical protein